MSDVFRSGGVAVITGGANAIGAATARLLAAKGMKLVLFDRDAERLNAASRTIDGDVRTLAGDVAKFDDVERLRDLALNSFGRVDLLMNNAAVGGQDDTAWSGIDAWRRILDTNLWGVINGVQAFAPAMIAQDGPSAIVNTGSKQGITNPPGHPAYAVSKSGVKTLTEQLAHELREATGDRVRAHLLIPGWTFTGMSSDPVKPDGAWTAEQVAEQMISGVDARDFYILCPDNQATPGVDAARIRWAAGDLAENRPALSRWHKDWAAKFAAYVEEQIG